jgi:hypothetical protein
MLHANPQGSLQASVNNRLLGSDYHIITPLQNFLERCYEDPERIEQQRT